MLKKLLIVEKLFIFYKMFLMHSETRVNWTKMVLIFY